MRLCAALLLSLCGALLAADADTAADGTAAAASLPAKAAAGGDSWGLEVKGTEDKVVE